LPTYIYETIPKDPNAAPRRFEYVQSMRDDPLRFDPVTGEPVRRIITGGLGALTGSSAESSAHGGGCGSHACGGGHCH
jgi:predicted nucleic acid-binding Zn ribbon protein